MRPRVRDAEAPRTYPIVTFACDTGHRAPYVLVIESPSGESVTYRWETKRERAKAARGLPSPPLPETPAPAAEPEPPAPVASAPAVVPAAAPARLPAPAVPTLGRVMETARTPLRSRTVAVAAACAACGAAPIAVAAGAPAVVRFPLVLLFMCLVPGTAVLNLLGPSRVPLDPGLVLVTSLAISALTAQSMLWLGIWAPDAFLNALAAGSVAVLAAANLREQAANR